MADDGQSGEDRTEAATQRHLDRSREEGNVPVSREVAAFASLAAVLTVLIYQVPALALHAVPRLGGFTVQGAGTGLLARSSVRLALASALDLVFPVLLASVIAGAAGVLLQTKFLLHPGAIVPKWSRVNPVGGLKRMFGPSGAVELVKSLGKLVLVGAAAWIAIKGDLPSLVRLPWQDTHALLATTSKLALKIMLAGLFAQGAVAAIDLGWVRFRHARALRMSKQDIRDEFKETEGNPHIKARIRRIRAVRARKRMMAKVPSATVVVTNPTHYAVALAYDRANNPAPRIVAKGMDTVAAKIREVAQAANVPIVANPPLARALYRLALDAEIPAEHYKAVAEIIAFVWRLRRLRAG
jgi:flagellar biosynthetic protein FlhB